MDPTAERIIREVARETHVTYEEMKQKNRERRIIDARDAAIKRMRKETRLSYPAIGRLFNINHSSVWCSLHRPADRKACLLGDKVAQLWLDHTPEEIAEILGASREGVRKAAKRRGLGPAYRKRCEDTRAHRPFTPRCAEIFHAHGVLR